ncbi:Uncharacterised protein [Neisseria meningitidis]|nr:hypothetical protein NM0552_0938 [Neisseria meningitidis NM0552]CWN60666.1 Uncharacterised protein [Neisseria meningitidis]CWR51387.1 Uncharacterised protein [Neisseria meningitidis]
MNKYRLKAFQTVFCPDLRRKGAVAGKSFHCSLFFLIRLYMWETGKSELCLIVLNNLYYLNYKLYKSFCMG